MYFAEFNIILSTCFCLTSSLSFNGFQYVLREINATASLLDSSMITTKWIRQPLHHFNKSETRTWKMKYFQRLDKWKPTGPIYLHISGEWKAAKGFLQTGILYELAKETNGAMYLSEHRYYGDSKPFKNFTTENLKYLSSRQALADLAKLITKIKKNLLFTTSKVVVVGGSYAGNLAAWMKLLYPNLVDAAIASSGPVLAKEDFYEYIDTVSDDYEQHGTPNCYDKITEIFNRYEEKFKTETGIAELKEEEQICEDTDMKKSENKELFFLDKISEFMSEAQYGTPESIKRHCEKISNSSQIFSAKDEETDMWNERKQCFDYDFDSMIESIKTIDWYHAWIYQTCTEFGYFQITAKDYHPFTENVHIEFFEKMCTDLFGAEFDGDRVEDSVKKTNELYGGLSPNVTHIVFVNGDLDPWHRLSVLEDISYEAPAKIIPRSSHCRDLFSNKDTDPEELKEARGYIKYLIKWWIGAGEYGKPKVLN